MTRRSKTRWWLVAGLAAMLLIAAVIVQQLLPLRSLAGLTTAAGCTPTLASTRLPDNDASSDGHWQPARHYPERRDEVRAATVGNAIFVGTGLTVRDDRFVPLAELFRFDPARESYEELPEVPVPVDHAALVGHDGFLYVIGGYDGDEPTATVWRFSPASGTWDQLRSLQAPRASPAAAVIDDRIYVVGGAGGSRVEQDAVATLEIYDIATGTWRRGMDMPTARHHHAAATRAGRLVVVGGRSDADLSLDTVEEFDPVTQRWQRLAPLPIDVGGLAAVNAGDTVVVVGGGDDGEQWVTPATWALAPGATEWRRLADLEVSRHGHAAAAVGSTAYVFAGAPCPGYGRTDRVEQLRVDQS